LTKPNKMAHDSAFLDDELDMLDRSKAATFSLEAVITAKTEESAQKTHDAVKKICSTVISAYEKVKDPYASHEEKREAVHKVATLEPQVAWLVEFSRVETDWCKTPEVHKKMDHVASTIYACHDQLKSDFHDLKCSNNPDSFMTVFDKILALLEHITEFLRQGHAAEVCRVLDNGAYAHAEAKNMNELELPHLLVQQSRNLKDRVKDFLGKTHKLITIQEAQNKGLKERISNVELVLDGHITGFILRTKDHLLNPSQPELKAQRTHEYEEVKSCLQEIERILQRIKAKYSNLFEEGALQIDQDLDDLDQSAYDLMNTLAQLHVPATTAELENTKLAAAKAIPQKTQEVLSVMAQAGADPELKKELVGAVKKGRDGGLPEYFDACEILENCVRKSHVAPPLQLSIPIGEPAKAVKQVDMLEAAKRMCAALKGINLALDD